MRIQGQEYQADDFISATIAQILSNKMVTELKYTYRSPVVVGLSEVHHSTPNRNHQAAVLT